MILTILKGILRGSIIGFIISLFLFLLVPSCQTIGKNTDKRLEPYINRFLSLCNSYKTNCSAWKSYKYLIVPIPKTVIDLIKPEKDSKTIGRCNHFNKVITIDETYFKTASIAHIESTVIHEMGHCVLKKSHVPDTEYSIMNAFALSDWVYIRFYQHLMDEFFQCKKNCPKVEFNVKKYESKLKMGKR
jgi:hypothetical protein